MAPVVMRRLHLRLRSAASLPALALIVTLGACGETDDGASNASPTATVTTTPTVTATSTATASPPPSAGDPSGVDPLRGASTRPVVVPATNAETVLLTDVRAARHEGFDRVVFEFAEALPGYDIRYVERPVREDGSGRVVAVKGASVLRVRMENALDADLSDPSAPRTYHGPNRFSPRTPEVEELVRVGGFEGVLTWVVGVRDQVDFRVFTLDEPARLVVDLRNH